MKHDEFFRKHPVFTGEELAAYLSSIGETGARTQEGVLAHQIKNGRLIRIRRSLFAAMPPGADRASYPVDPFLVAGKLTADAVLSHHTALEFHGRAYSVQGYFTYSAANPIGPVTFRSHVFRGATFPSALGRAGRENYEVLQMERAGMGLRVTSLERTLVDVVDRPDLSGSWEEIWRSLESIEFFDLDKVVEYARFLENATTAAKVGFFLDQHRDALMVEDRHLQTLQELRPRQPHYLERIKREPGRLISEWNLVVPRELTERVWAEVL